jgi:hypothetical protein
MNIFLDLETIAGTDVPEDLLKVDSRLKDPVKIAAAKKEALNKTSFDGAFGKIVSLAFAVDDEEIDVVTRAGPSVREYEALNMFAGRLDAAISEARTTCGADGYAITWVGHNIQFDLGFLFKRAAVNRIKLPFRLPWPCNPWDKFVCDTNYLWAGRDYVKLDTLALVLLGERKTNTGADVAGMWERGEYDRIAEYNRDDVRITREVHKKLLAVRNG